MSTPVPTSLAFRLSPDIALYWAWDGTEGYSCVPAGEIGPPFRVRTQAEADLVLATHFTPTQRAKVTVVALRRAPTHRITGVAGAATIERVTTKPVNGH